MLVSEEFILLLLDEKSGKQIPYTNKSLGLAGAIIMDLTLQKKVTFDGKKLKVVDSTSTRDGFLDTFLYEIKASKKKLKLEQWLNKFSRNYKDKFKALLARLKDLEIIKKEEEKILKIFRSVRYRFLKPEIKKNLLEQIQGVLLDEIDSNEHLICLLSLIKASNLYRALFTKEFRKQFKNIIDELISSEKIGKAIQDIINAMMLLMIIRISAAVAAA